MVFARNVGACFVGIDAAGGGTSSVFREAGQRSVADIGGITDVLDLRSQGGLGADRRRRKRPCTMRSSGLLTPSLPW